MPHYDPTDGSYTTTIPAGTAAFREVVGQFFGFRTEVVRDQSRCQQSPSEHCEARAIDFFVAAPGGRPLFDWAVAHADELGIQSVIYNHRVWGFGNWTERAYTGPSPHVDHVHIGLTKAAAQTLTAALVRMYLPLPNEEEDVTYLIVGDANPQTYTSDLGSWKQKVNVGADEQEMLNKGVKLLRLSQGFVDAIPNA